MNTRVHPSITVDTSFDTKEVREVAWSPVRPSSAVSDSFMFALGDHLPYLPPPNYSTVSSPTVKSFGTFNRNNSFEQDVNFSNGRILKVKNDSKGIMSRDLDLFRSTVLCREFLEEYNVKPRVFLIVKGYTWKSSSSPTFKGNDHGTMDLRRGQNFSMVFELTKQITTFGEFTKPPGQFSKLKGNDSSTESIIDDQIKEFVYKNSSMKGLTMKKICVLPRNEIIKNMRELIESQGFQGQLKFRFHEMSDLVRIRKPMEEEKPPRTPLTPKWTTKLIRSISGKSNSSEDYEHVEEDEFYIYSKFHMKTPVKDWVQSFIKPVFNIVHNE
jgi:hypothetical protein